MQTALCRAPGDQAVGLKRRGVLLAGDAVCLSQELRSREEELTRAALQQKSQEALLRRREQQLAEREIDVLERELNILIFQLNQEKPNVKRRKGKFRRSRLKLRDGHRISLPSGMTLPVAEGSCLSPVISCFVSSEVGRHGG